MLGLIVATSGVITLLIWLMRDDVILGWAEGNPSAQEILAQGGIEQLRDSPIVPGFVALARRRVRRLRRRSRPCSASFFVGGHGWTRLVLTATAGSACWSARSCLDNNLPAIFVVLSALVIVEGLVLSSSSGSRETTAYLRQV